MKHKYKVKITRHTNDPEAAPEDEYVHDDNGKPKVFESFEEAFACQTEKEDAVRSGDYGPSEEHWPPEFKVVTCG